MFLDVTVVVGAAIVVIVTPCSSVVSVEFSVASSSFASLPSSLILTVSAWHVVACGVCCVLFLVSNVTMLLLLVLVPSVLESAIFRIPSTNST